MREELHTSRARRLGITAELQTKEKRDTAHARQLRLRLADGKSWILHLDEGFGFVQTAGHVRFNFNPRPEQQANDLLDAEFPVEPRRITQMYASDV